jgi:uncharacterized protein (UPF0332 family)
MQFRKEFNDNFFKHIAELYIDPEIKRRRDENRLPGDLVLTAIQVVMNHDAPNEVRLNDEVSATVIGNFSRPVTDGDEVSIDDLESIVDIQLTDRDPNAGHVTLLVHRGKWVGRFDFRYNAARSRGHVSAAREFLDAAATSLHKEHWRPFVDNLHSATELLAKGILLLHDQLMLTGRSHGIVHSRFNQWGHLGNIDPRHTALLNKLATLRGPARYLKTDFQLAADEANEMIAVAEDMFADALRRVPQDRQ